MNNHDLHCKLVPLLTAFSNGLMNGVTLELYHITLEVKTLAEWEHLCSPVKYNQGLIPLNIIELNAKT